MSELNKKHCLYENYPWHIIILRWIILSTVFILGVYICYQFNQMVAWLYIFYSVFALTLILPLARCIYCYYHNRWCNFGWGKIAGYLFKKGDEGKYVEKYPFAILLYPLWLIPLLVGLIQLIRERNLVSLILLVGYVLFLYIEKLTLRFVACTNCQQKSFCPALPFKEKKDKRN